MRRMVSAVMVLWSCGADAPCGQDTVPCGEGTELVGTVCVPKQPMTPPPPDPLTKLAVTANAAFDVSQVSAGAETFFLRRLVVTDLGIQSAQAWARDFSPMMGSGAAIHFAGTDQDAESVRVSYFTLVAPASCSISPQEYPKSGLTPSLRQAYGALYAWSEGKATVKRCIVRGSLKVDRNAYPTRVTLTAEFDDGTLWSEKTLEVAPSS
jgi:hypothetical protein